MSCTIPRLRPENYWAHVDDILNARAQPNAIWHDELKPLYEAGMSVGAAVNVVIAGRWVK